MRTPNCERPETSFLEEAIVVAILSLFEIGAFGAASGLVHVFAESVMIALAVFSVAIGDSVFSKVIISVLTRYLRLTLFDLEKKNVKKGKKSEEWPKIMSTRAQFLRE